MPRPANVKQHRVVNAFFPNAEVSAFTSRLMGGAGTAGLKMVQDKLGGLWVGGDAYLTNDQLIFEPNGINKAAHANPESLSVAIPLRSITSAKDRFGVLTRIIDIEANGAKFSVRCFGAASFAAAIEAEARR